MAVSNRDRHKLEAFLDGKLRPSASLVMAGRVADEPELAAALDQIRETRRLREDQMQHSGDPQGGSRGSPASKLIGLVVMAACLLIMGAVLLALFSL